MKKGKLFALAGVTLLSAGLLAACSGGSATNEKVFNYVYETDPDNLNYLTTGKAATADITQNLIDGLLENDRYGNLVPSLAEDWTVSADGLTYTYQLRKGAKWVQSDGEEYAEVKAQDFVDGLKYAADNNSEGLYIVQDSVKGLDDYIKGKNKDFSQVGVKAIDDYTIQYTLTKPETFWNSKTTMSILAPVNGEFLKSQGKDFAKTSDPSTLLYNGPFVLKSLTAKSSVEMAKNESYWDKDNVHFDSVKLAYYDGTDLDALGRGFDESGYTWANLNANSPGYKKIADKHKDEVLYGLQDPSTFLVGFNIDRQAYEHTSKKDDSQKSDTKKAILNKDFRLAVGFAFDRHAYAAQINGEDGADKILRSTFVPSDFVQADGKNFGKLVEAKLADNADWKGVNLDDGQDSVRNVEKAKAKFETAKKALEAEGVKFPIHLDVPVDQQATSKLQRVQSLKQSVEEALGKENVVLDIQQMSSDDVNNITYFAETAAQEDWDLNTNVGWTPDYTDPSSYLDVINPSKGESTKTYLGFDAGKSQEAVKAVGLDEYQRLLEEASAETSDLTARYEKYAAAQAWLTDSGLMIPAQSRYPRPALTRIVPFTAPYANAGNKGSVEFRNYKYMEAQKETVTAKEFQAAKEKWEKEKAESNKKAQEELKKHVK